LTLVSLLGSAVPTVTAQPPATPASLPLLSPVTWSDFQPQGWITSLPITTSVTASDPAGLDPNTAEYQISTDGGASWSDWSTAGLSISGAVSTTQTITVTGLTLPDAADNRIRFRIRVTGGITETSPAYKLAVDTTPPDNPSAFASSSHAVSVWSNDPTVDVNWDAGSDATSGVGGYALLWDHAPLTVPEPPTTTATLNATSPPLPDGADHYVHLRTADRAGLWATDALHLGPFLIDTQPPTSTITFPTHGSSYASVDHIKGTAADPASAGVTLVEVSIQDVATGNTWDGTAWVPEEQWLAAAGTTAWELATSLPPWANGRSYTICSRATDGAGNVEAPGPGVTFTFDNAAPGAPIGLTVTPSDWTNVDDFDIHWTNPPDPAGIAGAWYKLDAPPTSATDGIFVASPELTSIEDLSVGSDGAHDLYLWLQDGLGNADHTQAAAVTLRLDTTPPGAPTNLDASPDGWQTTNSFTVTWRNPPDLSGIAGAYWKLNAEPGSPDDGTFIAGAGLTRIADLAVPAEGQHDLYLWLQDAAGNTDHRNRNVLIRAFSFDATPPITTLNLNGPQGLNGWYTGAVGGMLTAVDVVSGVAGSRYRINASAWVSDTTFTLPTDGIYNVEYQSWDVAGNMEPMHTVTVSIDSLPPTTAHLLSSPPGPGGWYSTTVTVTLTISDDISGPAAIFYQVDGGDWLSDTQNVEVVFGNDGQHLLQYYGQDVAGNVEAIHEVAVPIDMLPPSTAYFLEGREGLEGWFISPVTVTLVPSDTVSGIAATYYRVDGGPWQSGTHFVVADDGIHTLEFYSVDGLGNVEQGYPVELKIDTQPPGPPTRPLANPAGWTHINDFDILWANPQDLSGIGGACYKLNDEPTAPDDGICRPVTGNMLHHVQVPDEGTYDLFLWLRDRAGNADHNNRNVALDALHYDATPPTTTLVISGNVGWNGWYTSPLTLTFDVDDELSGPANARYRIDGGPWRTGLQAVLADEDKHVVEYYGLDVAGNEEISQTTTLRMDLHPPAPPTSLTVWPQGWSRVNRFRASWSNPLDFSGIVGAFYRFDTPPATPYDGTFVTTTTTITDITVPSEGRHDLYIWLADAAGNADPTHWVMAPDAVWYDGTPPTTTLVVTGTEGASGWYVSDLEASVIAEDRASGVAETWYRIDEGDWVNGSAFVLTAEGQHRVKHYAVDVAGNVEMTRTTWLNIDRRPPQSSFVNLAAYQTDPIFHVQWRGSDGEAGSGVIAYDLQVRLGRNGPWLTWLVNTPMTSSLFAGQRGHTYYFRVRARDRAGHLEEYRGGDGDARTAVQAVINNDFESQTFAPWMLYGALSGKSVVTETLSPHGEMSWAAQLGSPDYGPGVDPPGTVPVGRAVISQTVVVPGPNDMIAPALTFWYHIYTYDVLWSERYQKFYDSFEVTIHSSDGITLALALRDGNDVGPDPQFGVDYGVLKDLGWRYGIIDLTPYAGQTIQIVFANHNRWDNRFNTWTFLDDVQIVDRYAFVRRYFPLVTRAGEAQAAVAILPRGHLLEGRPPR